MTTLRKLKNYKNFRLAQSDFLKLCVRRPIKSWKETETDDEIELTVTFDKLSSIDDVVED